jgi:hypothetical protein
MRYHELDGIPMYDQRYDEVLSYHAPGLAPARKGNVWFHITPKGERAYQGKFDRVFGYYYGLAAVSDGGKWFHISPDGRPAYRRRFKWVGNFQENLCTVMDNDNHFYHIDPYGNRIYEENYRYVGDFHEGVAAVQGEDGLFSHITRDGKKLNSSMFLEAGAFHKGYATVSDTRGWFHCNRDGNEMYSERYASVEPFYNGFAKVTGFNQEIKRIDETGLTVHSMSPSLADPLMRISHDLVGYWKSFLLGKALEAGIFELLPADVNTISKYSSIPDEIVLRIMQALQERNYVERRGEIWALAEDYLKLSGEEKSSLKAISNHWLHQVLPYWLFFIDENYHSPKQSYRLTQSSPAPGKLQEFTISMEDAMTAYASHDYKEVVGAADLCRHKIIIDAGGGQGYLSTLIASVCRESEIYLMEASAVNKANILFGSFPDNVKPVEFDLLSSWKVRANAVVLAKILHDWDDSHAGIILKRAREALLPDGRIYIIESGFDPASGKNGLLSLHLYLVSKGKERSGEEMKSLLQTAGFRIVRCNGLDFGLRIYACEAV